jgi:hypothetical protein
MVLGFGNRIAKSAATRYKTDPIFRGEGASLGPAVDRDMIQWRLRPLGPNEDFDRQRG